MSRPAPFAIRAISVSKARLSLRLVWAVAAFERPSFGIVVKRGAKPQVADAAEMLLDLLRQQPADLTGDLRHAVERHKQQ